jgi:DUF971 family protein
MSDERGAAPGNESPFPGAPLDTAATPRDLNVKLREQKLFIDWADGVRAEYSLAALRAECPCATCRTEREEQSSNPLRILRFDPAGVRVVHAELVGNYAVQFRWSDGHDAGIFDFRSLRARSDRAARPGG